MEKNRELIILGPTFILESKRTDEIRVTYNGCRIFSLYSILIDEQSTVEVNRAN